MSATDEKKGLKQAKATAVIIEFIQAVEDMRYCQRAFFAEKKDPAAKKKHLDNAKFAEKEVDRLLLKFNIHGNQIKYSEQKKLF